MSYYRVGSQVRIVDENSDYCGQIGIVGQDVLISIAHLGCNVVFENGFSLWFRSYELELICEAQPNE